MPNGLERQPNPEGQTGNPQSQLDHDLVKWTRAVAWFTGLLFAANAIGLFFIYQQWSVANKAQVDTREQLRAVVSYQFMAEYVVNDKDSKPLAFAFQPQFVNSGGTRTAQFRPWVSIQYFDGEVPNNIDLFKPRGKIDIVNAVIAPNSAGLITPVTLSTDEAEKVRQKAGVALIWGHADWADIFEPTHIHRVHFCVKLEPITTLDGKNILQATPYKPECNTNE